MIDIDKLWDIMRDELCLSKDKATTVVLLRRDALKKVVDRYNKGIVK
jgi:hypothetical protein